MMVLVKPTPYMPLPHYDQPNPLKSALEPLVDRSPHTYCCCFFAMGRFQSRMGQCPLEAQLASCEHSNAPMSSRHTPLAC